MKIKPLLLLAAVVCPAFGQTSPILAGAGYSSPAPVEVAPGQVITLFLRGVPPAANGQLRSGEASDAPLAATLAGISVTIAQAQAALLPVPIFAVRQERECAPFGAPEPACLLNSIKVPIPFEL